MLPNTCLFQGHLSLHLSKSVPVISICSVKMIDLSPYKEIIWLTLASIYINIRILTICTWVECLLVLWVWSLDESELLLIINDPIEFNTRFKSLQLLSNKLKARKNIVTLSFVHDLPRALHHLPAHTAKMLK